MFTFFNDKNVYRNFPFVHSLCTLIALQKQYQNYRKTRDSQLRKREKMTQFFFICGKIRSTTMPNGLMYYAKLPCVAYLILQIDTQKVSLSLGILLGFSINSQSNKCQKAPYYYLVLNIFLWYFCLVVRIGVFLLVTLQKYCIKGIFWAKNYCFIQRNLILFDPIFVRLTKSN